VRETLFEGVLAPRRARLHALRRGSRGGARDPRRRGRRRAGPSLLPGGYPHSALGGAGRRRYEGGRLRSAGSNARPGPARLRGRRRPLRAGPGRPPPRARARQANPLRVAARPGRRAQKVRRRRRLPPPWSRFPARPRARRGRVDGPGRARPRQQQLVGSVGGPVAARRDRGPPARRGACRAPRG
jgi:hypothetical protein